MKNRKNFAAGMIIPDYPLMVLPRLAQAIGLNEAIFLQQIYYWLNSSEHFYDGRYWIYNTVDEWCEQFPFWSKSTIERIIRKLRKLGLIQTTNDYNSSKMDRKLWYTVNLEELAKLDESSVDPQPVPSTNNREDTSVTAPSPQIDDMDNISVKESSHQVDGINNISVNAPSHQVDGMEDSNLMECSIYTETTQRLHTETTIDNNNNAQPTLVDSDPSTHSADVVVVFENQSLLPNLIDLGIQEVMIEKYAERHTEEYIQEKYDITIDTASRKPLVSTSGFFVQALKEDYQPCQSSSPEPTDPTKMTSDQLKNRYIPDEYSGIINPKG